jgi:hypothetical protein
MAKVELRGWLDIQLRGAALLLRRAARPVSKHEGVSRGYWILRRNSA